MTWLKNWKNNPRMVKAMLEAIGEIEKETENKNWFHSSSILSSSLLSNYRRHVIRILIEEGICEIRSKNKRVYQVNKDKLVRLKKEIMRGEEKYYDVFDTSMMHPSRTSSPLTLDEVK